MEEGYELMNILSIEAAKKFRKENKTIIVTGVTGQDGSFMVDYLLRQKENYEIFGGARRLSVYNHGNIEHLKEEKRFHLINFDLTDAHSISQLVSQLQPDYFINFAAQSFVKSSWDFPAQTWDTNTTGVLNILEAIRLHAPNCRFYNAGSSEEFGDVAYSPQDEAHPLRPRSPYAASKAGARQLVKVYRESYGLYAVQGWLFNHEGTRRGEEFVTRKITKGVVEIYKSILNNQPIKPLELGNLDAKRDWSDAEDCVDAVWRMLNQEEFDIRYDGKLKEYVVASGESHSVRDFLEAAFAAVKIKGEWSGKGVEEYLWYESGPRPLPSSECVLVKINPAFYRPAEVAELHGNPLAIKKLLGWNPKTTFEQLVQKMVEEDEFQAGLIAKIVPVK